MILLWLAVMSKKINWGDLSEYVNIRNQLGRKIPIVIAIIEGKSLVDGPYRRICMQDMCNTSGFLDARECPGVKVILTVSLSGEMIQTSDFSSRSLSCTISILMPTHHSHRNPSSIF